MRRCRNCGRRRSIRSFVVLALGMPAALYLWLVAPKLGFILGSLLLAYLALVFVIDVEHRAILHETSYFGAVLGLLAGTYLHSLPQGEPLLEGLKTSLLGGAAGFAIMYALYLLGELFSRWLTRRRRPEPVEGRRTEPAEGEPLQASPAQTAADPEEPVALGFGDVNLTGILGLVLGWPGILFGLFFAILASGIASLAIIVYSLLARKYRSSLAIPYAPFLIFGAVLLLYR